MIHPMRVGLAAVFLVAASGLGLLAQPCTITVQPGESIQAAIDAAPEGAVICLTEGQWDEDIIIAQSLTLRGEGPENSVIRTKDSVAAVIIVMTPDGAEPVQVVIADLSVHGREDVAGIVVADTAQLSLTDCMVSRSEFGVFLIDSARLTMSGCILQDNTLAGIALWDEVQGTITDCTISGSDSGIALGELARATVENNHIIDNAVGVHILDDTAEVIGSGNVIPGPGEADGNTLAAVEPTDLGFLVTPRVDPAPPIAPPGWKGVRAGDLCLMVPEGWSDFTEEWREEMRGPEEEGGEILGAWLRGDLDIPGDARIVSVLRMSAEEREYVLGDFRDDPEGELVEEGPYNLAGRPAKQFLFSFVAPDVDGEGRMWLALQDTPDDDGWYLGVTAGYLAVHEPEVQEILASISVCEDAATTLDEPVDDEIPFTTPDEPSDEVGTIRFTLQDEPYSFPAVGHRDPETGATVIGGGSEQAAVSLSFAEVHSPGSYSPEVAGTVFVFQWLDGEPPFSTNVPGPTYMVMPGLGQVQLTITEYGPVGGTISGAFESYELDGVFEVERTQ